MSDISDIVPEDFRYGIFVVCGLVAAVLLLLIRDLTHYLKETFLPGLVIYTIGTGFIAYIQHLITVYQNTKAEAQEEGSAKGIGFKSFIVIIIGHVIWFALFVYHVTRPFY